MCDAYLSFTQSRAVTMTPFDGIKLRSEKYVPKATLMVEDKSKEHTFPKIQLHVVQNEHINK